MAQPSLYRALSSERRLAIITHLLATRKEMRAVLVARLVARGGGFRAVTVASWPASSCG